jgi:GTP cyclohydrolase II
MGGDLMADTEIRAERWENGVLVDTRITARPTEDVNRDTIREQAQQALLDNAEFLALGAGITNAQAVTQIRALTRQNNKVIRMLLQQFDSVD